MGLRIYGGNGARHASDSDGKSENEMPHKYISEKYLNEILMQLDEFCEHSKYYRQVRFHFRIWICPVIIKIGLVCSTWPFKILVRRKERRILVKKQVAWLLIT